MHFKLQISNNNFGQFLGYFRTNRASIDVDIFFTNLSCYFLLIQLIVKYIVKPCHYKLQSEVILILQNKKKTENPCVAGSIPPDTTKWSINSDQNPLNR